MSTLVVQNLPYALHERLRQLANRNHRLVSEQVIKLIEPGVAREPHTSNRPARITIRNARLMTRDELETALNDTTYSHYQSIDELNTYLDERRG